jgi:hypothetical protein
LGERVAQASLFASHAPESEVGVGQCGIDRDHLLETAGGLGVLVALLADQAKLVLRVAVVGIDGGGLQHASTRNGFLHYMALPPRDRAQPRR